MTETNHGNNGEIWRTGLLGILLLLASYSLAATQEDRPPAAPEQPLYIEADSVELDEQQATSLYLGNVIVVQGSMRIEADRVLARHRPDRRPVHLTAWGNPASYHEQAEPGGNENRDENRANALRMEYDVTNDEITLIDEAVLFHGNDRFSSDRIVYDRAKARVKAGASAAGSERVQIMITPESQ